MASEVDRLPETPVVVWSQWRTPWWSPLSWGLARFGPDDRRGVVQLSVHGITIEGAPVRRPRRRGTLLGAGDPHQQTFIAWDDIVAVETVGSATTVAIIHLGFGRGDPVVVGERHIPWGRSATEVSARRAAVLARAWELAQQRESGEGTAR